jgi:hypothetical protein
MGNSCGCTEEEKEVQKVLEIENDEMQKQLKYR